VVLRSARCVAVRASAAADLIRHHRANGSVFRYAFDLIELNGELTPQIQLSASKCVGGERVIRIAGSLGMGCHDVRGSCVLTRANLKLRVAEPSGR
jgi:hypothetical protein